MPDPKIVVNLAHIFLAAPFLAYIGIEKSGSANWVYNLLIVLGFGIILYHSIRYFNVALNEVSTYGFGGATGRSWVYYSHIIFALIFIVIGFLGKKTPNWMYMIFKVLAVLILVIHGSLLVYHIWYPTITP